MSWQFWVPREHSTHAKKRNAETFDRCIQLTKLWPESANLKGHFLEVLRIIPLIITGEFWTVVLAE